MQKYWHWPNFTIEELACRHCGELFYWPDFFDKLQKARNIAGVPFNINSGHRCGVHNALVGGAPLSQHLKVALDIDLRGGNRHKILNACKVAGFTGFGLYQTFLHVDWGLPRTWYGGDISREIWR